MTRKRESAVAIGASHEFDWDLIRSFLAVIDSGSLTAAARALGCTQPTLGRHIERLEAQLDQVLFERTGRGLEPTDGALAIAEHAHRMRSDADDLARAVTGAGSHARALVRIAASRQVATHILPDVIASIHATSPEIDIGIVPSDRVSNLLRRDADIAIRNVRLQQASLIAKKVGEHRIQPYASRAYLERHGVPQTLRDLANHRLVGADRDPQFRRSLERIADKLGMDACEWRVAVRSDDYSTQFAAVRCSLGIGFSLSGLIARYDDLQAIDIELGAPRIPFWLAVHREIRTAPAIRTVFDLLSERLRAELLGRPIASERGSGVRLGADRTPLRHG